MEYTEIKNKLQKQSSDSINVLKKNFAGLRTRASSELVAPIMVSAYGQQMPINQLASITTPDAKTINLQVYDKEHTKEITKQISLVLDLNPQHTEQHIIVNLPQLTEERRAQYVKRAKQYSEETKIAIRAHRRNAMNDLNKLKDSISQDDLKKHQKNIEEQISLNITEIDNILKDKTKEIMSI
jgi:ribosome recycling factor